MSVIRFNKIFLSSFLLVFVLLFPLTAFAMVVTPSDAVKVPVASSNEVEMIQPDNVSVATSSNAFPSEEYMETDDFDILDAPALLSSGIGDLDNTIDYSGVTFVLNYHDMSGKVHRPEYKLNSDGYFSVARPADCADIMWIGFKFKKASLPSSGKYAMRVRFGCNTGVTYQDYGYELQLYSEYTNVKVEGVSSTPYFDQSSGDLYFSQTIQLSGSTYVVFAYRPTSSLNDFFPYGGYLDVNFERLSSSANVNVTTPGAGDVSSSDIQQDISSNTAQQVEQGDTIIELIKNTIQTISSQLTSFWNQLAGEFTNLYNKMNQQHQESIDKVDEQIDNDNSNTDKVTTAIESHGNFIIEGLKKLFIPSDEYFKAYFDDLYSWFSERFGFLSFPIDLLLEVIDIFVNSSQTDCVLVLPSFTIMENLLWPEMSFNLTEFLNTNFSFVVVAIKTVTSIYLVMAFVQLCEEKWNEVMMN